MKFLLLFALTTLSLSSFALTRHALYASYNTPGDLDSRIQILNFLKGKFQLSLVTDRFPSEDSKIDPTSEGLLKEFNRLAELDGLDELLILTDLHGVPREPGQESHSVLLKDKPLSLDEMIPGLKRLKEKNVKVAWIDFSCYSGATVALAKYGACIGTSGIAKFATQPQFVSQFAEELKEGSTFEEVFLRTRKKHFHHQLPLISTAAGMRMSEMEEPFAELFSLSNSSMNQVPAISEKLKKLDWTTEESEALQLGLNRGQKILTGLGVLSLAWDIARWTDVVRQERKYYERLYLAQPLEQGLCQDLIL